MEGWVEAELAEQPAEGERSKLARATSCLQGLCGNKVCRQRPGKGKPHWHNVQTLFYLKTCNQCFREQMAGVFTLNTKLIQSCICEGLGSFIPGFSGVL